MKKYFFILLIFGWSCNYDKFDPIEVNYKPVEQTITVSEIRDFVGKGVIQYNYILKGVVTSSDESGNFYKQLIIEDHTGAVELKLGVYDIYSVYNRWDSVAVQIGMLAVGETGYLMQVGYATKDPMITSPITSLPIIYNAVLKQNGHNDKIGQEVLISKIKPSFAGRVVIVKGFFENADKDEIFKGHQPFKGDDNQIVNVVTSEYANFYKDKLPKGAVRLRAIVLYDGNRVTLRLVDLSDVMSL